MKRNIIVICLFMFITSNLIAQDKVTRAQYIEMWKDEAIREMNEFGIPASITLAQGIFESGDGNSVLATQANNHFGIKCHKEAWSGDTFHYDDDEKQECFRKYTDARQSYKDHSQFLRSRSRYASLFNLEITDYVGWAKGLKAAGYATLPTYAERIIKIIEDNNLSQYDAFYGKEYNSTVEVDESKEVIISTQSDGKDSGTASIRNKSPIDPTPLSTAVMTMASYYKNSYTGRKIYENNVTTFVVVNSGDSEDVIAIEFDMFTSQLKSYNDLGKTRLVKEGDIVYIEPKKASNQKFKYHTALDGETIWYISQLYGVKMSKLIKKNGLSKGTNEVPIGAKIML